MVLGLIFTVGEGVGGSFGGWNTLGTDAEEFRDGDNSWGSKCRLHGGIDDVRGLVKITVDCWGVVAERADGVIMLGGDWDTDNDTFWFTSVAIFTMTFVVSSPRSKTGVVGGFWRIVMIYDVACFKKSSNLTEGIGTIFGKKFIVSAL